MFKVRLFFQCLLIILAPNILYGQVDWRNIRNGIEIPTSTYADQPYIVKTDDGAWLCILTTGAGKEGEPGQIVASTRSIDQGKTWSELVYLEPADGPEASYAVMLKVPSGRIYAFYNHNTDNIRWVKGDDPPYKNGKVYRVDSQGYFVFKYTDDHGQTWSKKRYNIPVREFEIDRNNTYNGDIRFFWNVGKAFAYSGIGYVPLYKVGGFGQGFFTSNEGVLLSSKNILYEKNPEKIQWETLPDGDVGLRTPPGGGLIAAEQSYVVLSDGSFYCVYRSVDGHPVYSYSRDQGHTWDIPQYQSFATGKLMKHPRAANFVWKCTHGKYLYWFHNHGGRSYSDRNPAWLCGGVEADGPNGKIIQWTQPEIVLYDDDPFIRMSYPDLVEENGDYFLTETQKNIARVHKIDPDLLKGLWRQFEKSDKIIQGLMLEFKSGPDSIEDSIRMPHLPDFVTNDGNRPDHGTRDLNSGFTIDMNVHFSSLHANQVLLDNRTGNGQGFCVQTNHHKSIELSMNDGRSEGRWAADPVFKDNGKHHVSIIVDGGPDIIIFVVDGQVCDGGEFRQFGWGRFNANLRNANGSEYLRISSEGNAHVSALRIYDRPLKVSEAISNYRNSLQ